METAYEEKESVFTQTSDKTVYNILFSKKRERQ
jgi:hypothetical protein